MTLTPEQQQQIIARLGQVWPKPRLCPLCGHKDWKMHARLFLYQALHSASATQRAGTPVFDLQQEGLPAVLFWCETCGYVVTLLADKLGITADPVSPRQRP